MDDDGSFSNLNKCITLSFANVLLNEEHYEKKK